MFNLCFLLYYFSSLCFILNCHNLYFLSFLRNLLDILRKIVFLICPKTLQVSPTYGPRSFRGALNSPFLRCLALPVCPPVPGWGRRLGHCTAHSRPFIRPRSLSAVGPLPFRPWCCSLPWWDGRPTFLWGLVLGGTVPSLPALILNPYPCPCLPRQTAAYLNLSPYFFKPIPLVVTCPFFNHLKSPCPYSLTTPIPITYIINYG